MQVYGGIAEEVSKYQPVNLMIQKPLVLLCMWPNPIAKYWAWKLLALMSTFQRPCSILNASHVERKINWALLQFQGEG